MSIDQVHNSQQESNITWHEVCSYEAEIFHSSDHRQLNGEIYCTLGEAALDSGREIRWWIMVKYENDVYSEVMYCREFFIFEVLDLMFENPTDIGCKILP